MAIDPVHSATGVFQLVKIIEDVRCSDDVCARLSCVVLVLDGGLECRIRDILLAIHGYDVWTCW